MNISGLLQSKVAGIPGWLIAVVGGVGIWYFFLRGKGATSGSSGVSADSAYGLGYAQGLQAAKGNEPPPKQPPPPDGTFLKGLDNRPPVSQSPPSGTPGPRGGNGGADGVGGPFRSAGSRSSEWSGNYFHPALTRRVVYSHFVRAVGGPSSHDHEVARVSRSSGIHLARLRALNPVYTGRIRVH